MHDFIRIANTVIYLICGNKMFSEMELVCPIVQDFYFPKLKLCHNNSGLSSMNVQHECKYFKEYYILFNSLQDFFICGCLSRPYFYNTNNILQLKFKRHLQHCSETQESSAKRDF